MIVARRVYLYGIAFASLWMLVGGLDGLIEVALRAIVEVAFGPFMVLGASDVAERVSFAGALTGIGLVTWLIHWGLASRAVARDGDPERGSAIRKLYLYLVLLVAGLVLLFNLRLLLIDLMELAFGLAQRSDMLSGQVVSPLALLISTGMFWAYHHRVAARDRAALPEVGAGATLRRWYVYVLAYTGLLMVLFGATVLITRLIEAATVQEADSAVSGRWLASAVAGRASTVVTGLVFWLAYWGWSTRLFHQPAARDPERDSTLRKVYLYAILLITVTWTVWSLGQVLYLLLRSLLVPSEASELWSSVRHDIGDVAANTLVFGIAWAYHAYVLKREAAAAPEVHRQATIRWIYGYIVSLVGAACLGTGLAGLLSTLLEMVIQGGVVRGDNWWGDQLSLFGTLIVVGLPVWLLPWGRLQGEVVAAVARRSLARRIYLFVVMGLTVLTLLGSGAYTLYQLLRVVLGERWSASNTSDLIETASAAAVAALLLAYHLRVFQRDAALAKQDAEAAPPPQPVAAPVESYVTLLVVQPADDADAGALQESLRAALPSGTTLRAVTMPASEAERLLGGVDGTP